jgi:hypothetical protein
MEISSVVAAPRTGVPFWARVVTTTSTGMYLAVPNWTLCSQWDRRRGHPAGHVVEQPLRSLRPRTWTCLAMG